MVDCEKTATRTWEGVLDLNAYIEAQIVDDSLYYVFLDEVQYVEDYELLLGSLFIKKNVDLYVASSCEHFLQGKQATNLSGRYVQKEVLPLSFAEYVSVQGSSSNAEEMFQEYLRSAFPHIFHVQDNKERAEYLENLYYSICSNDGEGALVYSIPCYDIAEKCFLRGAEKEYVVDLGMRRYMTESRSQGLDDELKNIVCLELLRLFTHVYTGVVEDYTVDFVAMSATGEREYYQVMQRSSKDESFGHALKSLNAVRDNYPKYVLTMDKNTQNMSHGGIRVLNLVDWLLETC